MFCTQKTLLWQGRPIRRPQGSLPAPGKGTVSCSGQRPAGLFHTGRAAAAGGAPLSGKKGAPCAPSVRTGKKRYCAAKSYGICSPFRAHGEEALARHESKFFLPPLPCARGRSGWSFPMHSAQGRSRGVSVPASRPRPSAWAAGPFQTGNGRKRKTPLESGVHFLMGRKMGLEPTATWATTRCSTN